MDEFDNVEPSEVSTDETVVPTSISTSEEADVDTVDNVQQLREYAKGLKKDLSVYKPTHEFIKNSFGDLEVAKQAHALFDGYTREQFDSDEFIKFIKELSPARADELVEKLATERASELTKKEVEKIFGGKPPTPEELKFFQEWKESGYGLAKDEDIPEELKYNEDGTPKSEKEIEFLRNLQKQVQEIKQKDEQKQQEEIRQREFAKQQQVQEAISSFSNDRIKILDAEFEAYNLGFSETDTPQQRSVKQQIRDFIIDGVSGAFLKSEEGYKDYNSAIAHIQKGEPLLARRYEARIEGKLLDIMRSDWVGKLLTSLIQDKQPDEPRPDLSNAGGSREREDTTPARKITGDDIYASLVQKGLVKP